MVDWEGLKSKREAAKHSAGGQWDFNHTMFDEFPAILAQHEADQRVIAAAERLAITVIHGPADEIDMALAEYDKAKQ